MDQPKIGRVLRLMKLMTGNVNYSVEDLSKNLSISSRSIYRYIDTFKEAGFVVQKIDDGVYKLGKESPYFKDISQLIHFTDEEAYIINQLIEALSDTNILKQNLRKKLTSVYNCTSMAECVLNSHNALNVNHIVEAIQSKHQVVLRDYASSHTGSIRDRKVEPFGFTTNYVQTWCYDTEDNSNKLFTTARISSVDVLDTPWQFETNHKEGYIDVFRISGFSQHQVHLLLGVMSHNLLLEEFPLAGRDITQTDDSHWMLDTLVCDYAGVGRFVLGMAHDIKIIDSPGLQNYINNYSKRYLR